MLGQHPELFGFPELNLSSADTLQQWVSNVTKPEMAWMRYGLVRTIAQFMAGTQTAQACTQAEQWLMANSNMTTAQVFDMLAAEIAPRRPVEKSPHSVSSDENLARLNRANPDAFYVHITRHPHSAGVSMVKSEWFRLALQFGDKQAYDYSKQPPVFDPQFHWLTSHERITRFLRTIPPERQLRVRGEDVLSDPGFALADICNRIGVSSDPAAIEEMMHPERSPFACPGPENAPHGNDPDFLEKPALRDFKAPKAPLTGPVPWRGDGAVLRTDVVQMARDFGYGDETPDPAPRPKAFQGGCGALKSLEFDGRGVPAAHANLLDNSYCQLPPMRTLEHIDYRPFPSLGWINFGSYSGSEIAVSVFDSLDEPAMVGMRLSDGKKIWQTALEILPGSGGQQRLRWVSGVLMAKLTFEDGTEHKCIFAGNAAEFVCLGQDGKPIWRNRSGLTGPPRCVRFTADNHLIFATTPIDPSTPAQVVKLDPVTGNIVDRVRLTAQVKVDGRAIPGGYQVYQSIIVHGDYAYVEGMFVPETPQPASTDARLPTTIMRFKVSDTPDGLIERGPDDCAVTAPAICFDIGTVGTRRQGGSPSAIIGPDGCPVVVTNGFADTHTDARPEYCLQALRDTGTALEPLWQYRITGQEDPKITAAPAIDPVTQTYLAATRTDLYLFGDVSGKRGTVQPDLKVPALDLLAGRFRQEATAAEVSSPIILARDPDEASFVAYLGLAAWTGFSRDNYAILTALQIDLAPYRVTPLWSGSMALGPDGTPITAARSFAQPALFEYTENDQPRTGLVMSTMMSGVAVMR